MCPKTKINTNVGHVDIGGTPPAPTQQTPRVPVWENKNLRVYDDEDGTQPGTSQQPISNQSITSRYSLYFNRGSQPSNTIRPQTPTRERTVRPQTPKGKASRSEQTLTSSPALNPNSPKQVKRPKRRFVKAVGERDYGTQTIDATVDASGSDTSSKYLPVRPTC